MIVSFQKTYRFSPDGIQLATYYAGDQIDIDPNGPQAEMLKSVLALEYAVEVKPEPEHETKVDGIQDETKIITKKKR